MLFPQDIEFPGFSAIADSDRTLIGQLGSGKEGVVVGIIALDPERGQRTQVQRKSAQPFKFNVHQSNGNIENTMRLYLFFAVHVLIRLI